MNRCQWQCKFVRRSGSIGQSGVRPVNTEIRCIFVVGLFHLHKSFSELRSETMNVYLKMNDMNAVWILSCLMFLMSFYSILNVCVCVCACLCFLWCFSVIIKYFIGKQKSFLRRNHIMFLRLKSSLCHKASHSEKLKLFHRTVRVWAVSWNVFNGNIMSEMMTLITLLLHGYVCFYYAGQ